MIAGILNPKCIDTRLGTQSEYQFNNMDFIFRKVMAKSTPFQIVWWSLLFLMVLSLSPRYLKCSLIVNN